MAVRASTSTSSIAYSVPSRPTCDARNFSTVVRQLPRSNLGRCFSTVATAEPATAEPATAEPEACWPRSDTAMSSYKLCGVSRHEVCENGTYMQAVRAPRRCKNASTSARNRVLPCADFSASSICSGGVSVNTSAKPDSCAVAVKSRIPANTFAVT